MFLVKLFKGISFDRFYVLSWGLFGGGGDEVSTAPIQDLEKTGKKAKKLRSALFKTEGGAIGEEIMEGDVKGRDSFFGN